MSGQLLPRATAITVPGGTQSVVVASQYQTLLGFGAAAMTAGGVQPGGSAGFRLHGFPSAVGSSQCLTPLIVVTGSQAVLQQFNNRGIATPSQVFLERTGGISEIVVYGY